MSDDKNLDAVIDGKGRDLPPLDVDENKSKSNGSDGSTAKIIKRVVIGFGIFVVLVIVAAVLVFSTAETASKEASKSVLEIVAEGSVSESLNPLLVDGGLEQSTYESHDKEALIHVGGNETDELETDQLSDVLHHLKVIDTRLEMLESGTINLSEQVVLERSLLTAEVERGEIDAKRIEVLETELAALVKEVKRLKWVERQKRVARKKVSNKPSLSVKSFFIWQYRPGVEIELSSGISERFYEGDLLDGMRLVRIDVDNEEVTLSKGAKRIVLKKQAGG